MSIPSLPRSDDSFRTDNKSYATLVPEEEGSAQLAEDPDKLETPNADKRTEETKARLQDPGSAETRDDNADDIADEPKDD